MGSMKSEREGEKRCTYQYTTILDILEANRQPMVKDGAPKYTKLDIWCRAVYALIERLDDLVTANSDKKAKWPKDVDTEKEVSKACIAW